MERTLTNLKNLPKLQLPTRTAKQINLPKIEAVPQLPRLALNNNTQIDTAKQRRYAMAQEEAARIAKENSYKSLTGLKDPNDPYTVNSIPDALFNKAGKEKRYGDFAKVMHKFGLTGESIVSYVALWDTIVVSPMANILKGDFKSFGINALTNFTETLDILSNPVKSIVAPLVSKNKEQPGYDMPWYERLGSSLGSVFDYSEKGRYNYNYDTGFWLADMGLEIISDPLTVIASIFTSGGWAAGKAAITGAAKGLQVGVKTLFKEGAKVALKKGVKVIGTKIAKKITKTAVAKLIKSVISLRKIGNTVSATTKKLIKTASKDASNKAITATLKTLVSSLDEALASSKGIVNDTVKSIIKDIGTLTKKLAANSTDDAVIKTLSSLTKEIDNFEGIANYTLKDFILDQFGDMLDTNNKVFTKKAKKQIKKDRKILRKLDTVQDAERYAEISEHLEAIFSDPASIKKYKHKFNFTGQDSLDKLEEALSSISFKDYIDKTNAYLQNSRALQLAIAMDDLAQGTDAVNNIIFKSAIHSSAPAFPFVTTVLKPLVPKIANTKIGRFTIKVLQKRLEDVNTFFTNKSKTLATLAYEDQVEAYRRIFKHFDLFTESNLSNSGFEKELARSIYNETFDWLRGYADVNKYAQTHFAAEGVEAKPVTKPINLLLASPEELRHQIVEIYGPDLAKEGITPDKAVEKFFEKFYELGNKAFGTKPTSEWNFKEYLKALKNTEMLNQARNAFKDFDEILKGTADPSARSVLTYARSIDTHNVTSIDGPLNNSIKLLEDMGLGTLKELDIQSKVFNTFPAKVYSKFKPNKNLNLEISDGIQKFYNITKEVIAVSEDLKVTTDIAKKFTLEDKLYDAVLRMKGTADKLRLNLKDYAKVEEFKNTEFAELYKQLQKISSPYYGQAPMKNYATSQYLELANSTRAQTLDILKDQDFSNFRNYFRAGQPGANFLEVIEAKAKKGLEQPELKVSSEKTLKSIESIRNTFLNLDNYVEHLALVKTTDMPEYLQEIYLDVLADFPVKDAKFFLQHLGTNSNDFIRKMNEKLTNRLAKQRYDYDTMAIQLLDVEGFKAAGTRYLNSARTAADEVELTEAIYRARVLPEFSKKVKNPDGVETNQYVYGAYNAHKDKQKVFISFKATGNNAALDSLSDLSFKFKDKAWSFDPTKSEIENLLNFYKQLKAISDAGLTSYITHTSEDNHLVFIRNRLYELMEQNYIAGLGDPELHKIYMNAKRCNAKPEELAEIWEKMQATVNPEYQKLFQDLSEAQLWFNKNLYYSNIDCLDLIKKFDKVPTIGEYYHTIVDYLLPIYVRNQAAIGGRLNFTLSRNILEDLYTLNFDFNKMGSTLDKFQLFIRKIQNYDELLLSRSKTKAPNGRMLIQENPYINGIEDYDVTTLIGSEVKVFDTSELLHFDEAGNWIYKGKVISNNPDVNVAIKALKDQGINYNPRWQAINYEQKLSTIPVMVGDQITLQPITGQVPVTVKKYVDMPLASSIFKFTDSEGSEIPLTLAQQHHFTLIASQAQEIIQSISDPRAFDEIATIIQKHWDRVIGFAKQYEGNQTPYAFLREDLNNYQKYAVLTVLYKDYTSGAPRHSLEKALTEAAEYMDYSTFAKMKGYKMPSYPEDRSRSFVGYQTLEMDQLPGFKQQLPLPNEPKQITPRERLLLGGPNIPFSEVYFKKFNEELTKGVPSHDAALSAYAAYKDAVKAHNNTLKTNHSAEVTRIKKLNKEIKKGNLELLKRHEAMIASKNKAQKDYLKQIYLSEKESYDKFFDKLKKELSAYQEAERLKPEVILENALRDRTKNLVRYPEYYVSKKSYFRKLYEENHSNSILGYTDNTYSRTSYIDHIYDAETRGTVNLSRQLSDALMEVNEDVLNSTKAFKVALERSKDGGQLRNIYAPGMQRHATLGMSLIDLNNKVIDTAKKFREGPEFDTFLSCDKQVVNNLEDLTLMQVFNLSIPQLTSFVQHQGRGVVIIPIGGYLSDTTAHSIDLRQHIHNFVEYLKQYESSNEYANQPLKFVKKDNNLILYIQDYTLHVKQQDIPVHQLNTLSFEDAFKAAYGYPHSPKVNPNGYKRLLAKLNNEFSENSYEYQKRLKALNDKYAKEYGVKAKQLSFILQHYDDVEKLKVAYNTHFESLRKLTTDYDVQYSYYNGGYGRTIDEELYQGVINYLPEEVRRSLGFFANTSDKDELNNLVHQVFNTSNGDIFNYTTLGRANYRLAYEPYASSNYQSIMANTYRSMAYNLSAATQYSQFYFEESPWALKNFFQFAKSDSEILMALKSTDAYTVSKLGIDKKGLPVVKEIKINSLADLRSAADAGAIITPTTTYGSIIQTMNNKRWNSSKLKIFHKIAYYTKMSMLILNPGFIFRNIIDSTLKNVLISKEKDKVLSTYLEAIDLHRKYQEVVDMLFAVNKDNPHPFRPDVIDLVLSDSTCPLTPQQFMWIHNFYENGPSAGSISKVADYYLEQSMKKGAAKPSTLQRAIDVLMKPTKDIEDITRFAAYIEATKRGLTNIDAFELIRKTHFDYATKTEVQYWLELVFPFYSFKLKNFEFWLDFASNNPSVTYHLLQLSTNEWNWSDIDFDRIEYYQSKLNHITQANIQLNKQGLTLKVNPSLIDPINLMLNPIESMAGSVAPWVQPIVDAIQQEEPYNYDTIAATSVGAAAATVPGLGVAGMALATGSQYKNRLTSGIRAYNNTGSVLPLVLPSVFGSVKTPAQYGRASYTNSRTFMDAEKRRPRRINIYNRYYTDSGKNRWKIRFYPIDAATVQYRIRDNYNRFR